MSDPVVFIFFPNPQVLRWILAVVELDRIAVPVFRSLGRCKAPVIQLSFLLFWLLYESGIMYFFILMDIVLDFYCGFMM